MTSRIENLLVGVAMATSKSAILHWDDPDFELGFTLGEIGFVAVIDGDGCPSLVYEIGAEEANYHFRFAIDFIRPCEYSDKLAGDFVSNGYCWTGEHEFGFRNFRGFVLLENAIETVKTLRKLAQC